MHKNSFLIACTIINLAFIGAQVFKHARVVQLNYTHNSITAEIKNIDHTIESLRQKICAHKDTSAIKTYAHTVLHMKPLSLAKVKRIAS
jgi:hypothetical protein